MARTLRAVVVGAGSAGEGHTLALRAAGVEVVAIASRTEVAARATANRLGIGAALSDWRLAIREQAPDIVSIATPGGTHVEVALEAIAAGCSIYVDKPLATTLEDARVIRDAVLGSGAKSAYAATATYQRGALMAQKLVAEGAIGELLEGEFASHFHWPTQLAYNWPHRLADGGGRLNNSFTHQLSIAEMVCDGIVRSAVGETRNDVWRAPIAEVAHDFREWAQRPVPPAQAARGSWGEADSDWAYTALARIGPRASDPARGVSVMFRHSCLRKAKVRNYAAFYGSDGTVHVDGAYCQGTVSLWREGDDGFTEVPISDDILERTRVPEREAGWVRGWEDIQAAWECLARDFVADIRGGPHRRYPTVEDGLRHQEVIAAVREMREWSVITDGS